MLEPDEEVEYIIKPPGSFSFNLYELWSYRELFYFFTWRDIKVKYKQTILGILWAVLQPLLMIAIFIIFFAKALKIPTDNIPAPVFYFSGLLLWNLFSSGISGAGNSMVANSNIIKKIYFPRLIIPISSILAGLFDFVVAYLIFSCVVIYYSLNEIDVSIIKVIIYYSFSLLLTLMTTLGLGCLIAALNVKYRDFRYVIPFFIQVIFFITPVIYPTSLFSDFWLQCLISINPLVSAIEIGRSAFMEVPLNSYAIGISIVSSVLIMLFGFFYFKKSEFYFADLA